VGAPAAVDLSWANTLAESRPVAFVHVEATGQDPLYDRVTHVEALVIAADADEPERTEWTCDPGAFSKIAQEVRAVLDPCHLIGWRLRSFVVPILTNEMYAAGWWLDFATRELIDLQLVDEHFDRRTYATAIARYTSESTPQRDASQLLALARGQMAEHALESVEALRAVCDDVRPYRSEIERWFGDDWKTEPRFQFGAHRGDTIGDVFMKHPTYINWLVTQAELVSDTLKAFVKHRRKEEVGKQKSPPTRTDSSR